MQSTNKNVEKTVKNTASQPKAKPAKPRAKKAEKVSASTPVKGKKNTAKAPVNDGFRKLKILITVVKRSKTEFFIDLLTAHEINFQTAVLAKGTATNETLSMLGLEDSEKCVIFSVLREDKAEQALQDIEEEFDTLRGGKGIAFTVPMSSVIGVAMYRFLSNHRPMATPTNEPETGANKAN